MSDEQAIERVRAYVEAPYELHDESQAQWRADLRTMLRLATPPVTGEVGELVERLEDEAQRLHGRGIDRGCVDSSLAGNLALEAAAMLERYAAALAAFRTIVEKCEQDEVDGYSSSVRTYVLDMAKPHRATLSNLPNTEQPS